MAARLEPSEHMLSAQFQATVYEVEAPAERLGTLGAKVLTAQAATPEMLLSVLAQTGKTRVLYQVDQPVNVFSTMSMIGSSEPVVTGTRMTPASNAVNMISYLNVGFIVRLSAQGPPQDAPDAVPLVNLAIKLSVLGPGEQEIAPGQPETVVRTLSLDHSEALALNQPQALLAISSNTFSLHRNSAQRRGTLETNAAPVGYVVRYQFESPAQGGSARAAASSSPSGAAGSVPAMMSPAAPETTGSTNVLKARFQATVYSVDAAINALPSVDAHALAAAASPELMLKALGTVGKPKLLYQIDQPVNVFSDEVLMMTNKPIVMATRTSPSGGPINSYTYHNLGVRFALSAQAPSKDAGREGLDVLISFNMSADAPGKAELVSGQSASAFDTISQEHNEPMEMGRPHVLLAAGSPSTAKESEPFVYVVRYQFDRGEAR